MRGTRFLLAVAVALGVACADQGPHGVTGTYTLRTVNGSGPPFSAYTTYGMGTYEGQPVMFEQLLEWISDTLRLNADGSFGRIGVIRETRRAYSNVGEMLLDTVTTHVANSTGTYTVAGNSIEFTPSQGAVWAGSVTGDVLTITAPNGDRWVYRR